MSKTMHIPLDRQAQLLSLLAATDRQYARERDHAGGPRNNFSTREGQAPSSIDAPPKPKASPRLTTSARDIPTHQANAPDRMRCVTCGDLARWVPIRPYGNHYAYWCHRNYSHELRQDALPKRRTVNYSDAKRSTTTRGQHTAREDSAKHDIATQVWVPTAYERANGARTVATRAL